MQQKVQRTAHIAQQQCTCPACEGLGLLPSTIIGPKHTGFITQNKQRALNIKYDSNKKSQRLSSLTFAEKLIKSPVKKWLERGI